MPHRPMSNGFVRKNKKPLTRRNGPKRAGAVVREGRSMKIFVLGVPHTQTTRDFSTCPFTTKTWNQCRMLHRRGHEVIHLGVEGSDPECSQNVAVVSRAE